MTYAVLVSRLFRFGQKRAIGFDLPANAWPMAPSLPERAKPPVLPEQPLELESAIGQRKAEALLRSVRCGAIRR